MLNSIQTSNVRVVAATTTILADTSKRNNFKLATDFLLLAAPVRATDSAKGQNISAVDLIGSEDEPFIQNNGGFQPRELSKTGVELRFYKKGEWWKLTDEQRTEYTEWRNQRI